MIYRKSSPNPPTFLLRIVASAGASALLGTAACSGTDPVMGSVASVADSGDERPVEGVAGLAPNPQGGQGGDDATAPPVGQCLGICGSATISPDADAGGPCNGGPCGAVAMPPDAGSGKPCNGGPCGTIVMPPPDDAGQIITGSLPAPPDDAGKPDASHRPIGVVPIPDSGVVGIIIRPDAGVHGPCKPCGVLILPDGGFGP